jgi:hypothetical protein
LRYIDHLRISGLNNIDRLTGGLLHLDLLLFIASQRSCSIRLRAQTLDRSGHPDLVGSHSLSNRRVVVDVIRHHLQHGRESDQSKKGRIVPLLLRGIGKLRAGEARVFREPVGNVENLLRVGGSRRNLGEQRVGIKCYRGQQLV